MYNPMDEFGKAVRKKRNQRKQTQSELAEKLGMSRRTVMEAEKSENNPKFETVILLAQDLDISLDALVFRSNVSPNAIPKCVYDYFKDKTEAEAQKLVDLCRNAEALGSEK